MSTMEKLLSGNLKKVFFHYLVTSVAGMMVFAFYVLVDTLFVGRFLGSEGLAALNVSLPIYGAVTGIGLLLGVGGGAAMSISLGEDNEKEATALFSTAVLLGIIISLIFTTLGLVFRNQFVSFLGGDQVNTSMVRQYVIPVTMFSFSFVFTQLFAAFARHDGAPGIAMWSTILGGFLNIGLDALFIVGFGWGMLGASSATIIASLASVLILLRHIRKSRILRFRKAQMTWFRVQRIVTNGGASLVVELSSSVVLFAHNRVLLSTLGELGVAAYGVIANYAIIALSIFTGVGQAVQPIASINHGAGLTERSRGALNLGMGISFVLGIIFYGVGLGFPKALTNFFVEATPELLKISTFGIRLYFLSFIFAGLNVTSAAYFQSLEQRQYSLQVSLLRGFVFVVLGLLFLPQLFGLWGVWLTVPLAELFTFGFVFVKEKQGSLVEKLALVRRG